MKTTYLNSEKWMMNRAGQKTAEYFWGLRESGTSLWKYVNNINGN